MIFDNHSHTQFSSDSDMVAREAIETMSQKGLGLVFTEHYDFDYRESIHYKDMDFLFDAQEYWQAYEGYRQDNLRLGVELGLTSGSIAANQEFLTKAPFDLVIGSIHALEGLDIYYPEFYQGKEQQEAYHQYLQQMQAMVEANSYIDILGHIDYIARYAPYPQPGLSYENFAQDIDGVLQAVIANDIVMELNTRRLGEPGVYQELLPIYQSYARQGGKYLSLGSDAHSTDKLGMNFSLGQQMAQACALTLVTFKERKLEICQ